MRSRTPSLAILASAVLCGLLLPSVAPAADLPVAYNVQDKPLKEAVAGTALTFQLHADSACTIPYFTQTVPIDDVEIISKPGRGGKGGPHGSRGGKSLQNGTYRTEKGRPGDRSATSG